MNTRLTFRPDLWDCVLEDRTLPVIASFGTIILTTSGLTLVTPFPGASNSASGSLGSSSGGASVAPSASGVPIPTYLFITGSYGISSLRPGNITGVPLLAMSASGGVAGNGLTIEIGSGADAAGGPTNTIGRGGATNNVVGNTTYADPTQRVNFVPVGRLSLSGPMTSGPASMTYAQPLPVESTTMGEDTATTSRDSDASRSGSTPDPKNGEPRLGPIRLRGLTAPTRTPAAPAAPAPRSMPFPPADQAAPNGPAMAPAPPQQP